MAKNRYYLASLAGLLLAMMTGMCADAAHVKLTEGTIALPLQQTTDSESEITTKDVTEFGLLGYVQEGIIAVSTGDYLGYITPEQLAEVLPALTLPELPNLEEEGVLSIGSLGDIVTTYQQALIDLGMLEGTADGEYGSMSSEATVKLQTQLGLDANGNAGPAAVQAALDLSGKTETIEIAAEGEELTLEEKFAPIIDKTEEDLTPYQDSRYRFSFDPFEERGLIDPQICLAEKEEGSSDLDRIKIRISLKYMCAMDYISEQYSIKPILEVVYTGAYRPYIKGAQMNKGSEVAYFTEVESESTLEGINVVETAYLPLDEEAFTLLKDDKDTKATLRVQCQDSYIDVPMDLSPVWK